VRLFERGVKFLTEANGATREVDTIAGACAGLRLPEQWGASKESFDFYDIKADVEALIAATGAAAEFAFEPASLPALHPGRSARISRQRVPVGWIGELHPGLVRALDLPQPVFLFELEVTAALATAIPAASEVSKFPQVRRDLAVVVDESITFSALRERVVLASPDALRAVRVFDVYTGKSVEKGRKSIALGLIYQDFSRTLTDIEADAAVAAVAKALSADLNARVRE
jgi:phenylalanyl-tRNA synthetase beta chain